jgi:hypothetical protein
MKTTVGTRASFFLYLLEWQLRFASGVNMTRDQLLGTWRCPRTGSTKELRSDGSCVVRTIAPNGRTYEEHATWEHIDATHWKLRLIIPPDPTIPGLAKGAVEVIDYEVQSEAPNRMSLMRSGEAEIPREWVRPEGDQRSRTGEMPGLVRSQHRHAEQQRHDRAEGQQPTPHAREFTLHATPRSLSSS